MKVTSLLIIWSLPLLPAGDHGLLTCHGCEAGASHARRHGRSHFVPPARDVSSFNDLGEGRLSVTLEEEEDSLEDDGPVDGLLLTRSWRDFELRDRSSPASVPRDLLRIPPRPHPLRC